MKTIKRIFAFTLLFTLFFSLQTIAQEEASENEFAPVYIVITTMHKNSDVDFADWLKIEEEYFDKVTGKNDLILHSGVYTHYFTADSSEILFLTVYSSWGDFDESIDVTSELIEEGWPDEEERAAFFEKQNNCYKGHHSDQMYSTLPYHKSLNTNSEEALIMYVRKNEIGEGGSGSTEYFENITAKNSYIKGYFTMRHSFGSNSNDALEVGIYESLADIESAFKENKRLVEEYWPDEEERKAFFKELSKIFNGHGDFIYQNVPGLAK